MSDANPNRNRKNRPNPRKRAALKRRRSVGAELDGPSLLSGDLAEYLEDGLADIPEDVLRTILDEETQPAPSSSPPPSSSVVEAYNPEFPGLNGSPFRPTSRTHADSNGILVIDASPLKITPEKTRPTIRGVITLEPRVILVADSASPKGDPAGEKLWDNCFRGARIRARPTARALFNPHPRFRPVNRSASPVRRLALKSVVTKPKPGS